MTKRSIYSTFRRVAGRQPDAPAVIEAGHSTSYAELDGLADAIMARFASARHKAVGIVMSHGAGQIAAILAVLKSGAAYVPAEPSLPPDRIDYMMQAAGATLVIDDDYCRDLQPASQAQRDRSRARGTAYILFTSGTTGKPKGVIVENRSVVNYAEAFEAEFAAGPGDVMLQYSVCSFDIFVEEVFASLLSGAAVCVPPPWVHDGSAEELMRFAGRHGVTIIDGFPYLLAELDKLPALPPSVRLIISGGDVLRASYIEHLKDSGAMIYNTYGPSETTVCSNYYRVDNARALPDGTFPVGKAIKGVEVRILDDKLRPVKPGDTGEICILGEGVSRGYTGRQPERKNFVRLPDGRRMYRSGDLGYELPDGNIAFMHRRDSQVMILGRRVEPDEVENVLNESPLIERGVVRAFLDGDGLAYLVAYFVPRSQCSLHSIKEWLRSKLSDFMVPEYFVSMQHIPVTSRGKVDTRALPVVMKEGGGR